MKLLVVLFCCFYFITADPVATSANCYVNYLKNQGFLGEKNETQKRDLSPGCLADIAKAHAAAEERYRAIFLENENAGKAECLIEKLRKTDTFDRDLLDYVDIYLSKADDSVLANSESEGILANMLNVLKATIGCEIDRKFDSLFIASVNQTFENLFKKDEKVPMKNEYEGYCVRNFLFKNNLISFYKENLNLNPKNITPEGLNCTVIYGDYSLRYENRLISQYLGKDKIETENDQKWANCFTRIIRQNKYVDQMQQFYFARSLGLNKVKNADKKEALRLIFIDVVTNIARTAYKCEIPDGLAHL